MRREHIRSLERRFGQEMGVTAMFELEADFSGTADVWVPPLDPSERTPFAITCEELIDLLEGVGHPTSVWATQDFGEDAPKEAAGRFYNETWNEVLGRYRGKGWTKAEPTLLEAAREYMAKTTVQDIPRSFSGYTT